MRAEHSGGVGRGPPGQSESLTASPRSRSAWPPCRFPVPEVAPAARRPRARRRAPVASAAVARDELPALDNLRRATESVPEDAADPLTRNLLIGVAATKRALPSALTKHGITCISPAPGEPSDPHWPGAISVSDSRAHPPGTAAEVLKPGNSAARAAVLKPCQTGPGSAQPWGPSPASVSCPND
jgi:molecular chaperone GrpE